MMKLFAAAAVVAMGMTGIATADEAKGPTVMTDAQMDNIIAGASANYDVYINNGGQYATVLQGDRVKGKNWVYQATIVCDDGGSGSCSYTGSPTKDFVWDAIAERWED